MHAYHMSTCIHPVGRVLTGNGRPKVEPQIEDALESARPKGCLSRLDSVYGRELPDFGMLGLDSGYIYRIVIRGRYQRHDARWIGQLQQAHMKSKHAKDKSDSIAAKLVTCWPDWTGDFVASMCANYWTAAASSEPLWELLFNEAEIEAQLSDAPIKADITKGGWEAHR